MVEWMIVITMYAADGTGDTTYRRGLPTKQACERALAADLKVSFAGYPAVKGHCIDFPARPAGLPEPKAAKKEGRDA